jgi:hypothetical protein
MIIAPVGAYLKRVQYGIKSVISQNCQRKTEVLLYLVVGNKWVKDDPKYLEECVQPLEADFAKDQWSSEFPNYRCEVVRLDPEDQDQDTLWLIGTLLSFLREGKNRAAFVDLTSAPREWVYSAFYVSSFFSDVYFYFVKSKRSKSPSQYSIEERTDEGTVIEYPITALLVPPLSRWLRPREEDAKEENIPYKIFRLIHDIAAKESSLDSEEITIAEDLLVEQAKRLDYYKGKSSEDVKKGVSRYLTDIERFGVFKRTAGLIVLNRKGIALMRGLFEHKSPNASDDAQ